MVQEDKTPVYCGVCGTRLEANDFSATLGFDVFTGERLTSENRSLECPNPTVHVTGIGPFKTTSTTEHPTWEFTDNSWVQG